MWDRYSCGYDSWIIGSQAREMVGDVRANPVAAFTKQSVPITLTLDILFVQVKLLVQGFDSLENYNDDLAGGKAALQLCLL